MKYFPPVGSADPDAPYIDESTGQEGSAVPARAIEYPQREIMTVITSAGLTPDEGSVSQLDEAINLKISNATSGGASPVDDLLLLLRARMPIYPEVNTGDGAFALTVVSAGSLQIPAGISITHRGCFVDFTSLQSLTTLPNKTYHLRRNWTTGWALKDLSDSAYNPGALAESDAQFDTTYDDMLTHRIVTNTSNIATITPLKNKNRLAFSAQVAGTNLASLAPDLSRADVAQDINWARTPQMSFDILRSGGNQQQSNTNNYRNIRPLGATNSELLTSPALISVTRYRTAHAIAVSGSPAVACLITLSA